MKTTQKIQNLHLFLRIVDPRAVPLVVLEEVLLELAQDWAHEGFRRRLDDGRSNSELEQCSDEIRELVRQWRLAIGDVTDYRAAAMLDAAEDEVAGG